MLENFGSAAAAASCFFHIVRSLSLSFAPSVCGAAAAVGGAATAAAVVAAVAFVVVFVAPLFWTDSVRVYLRM